MQENHSRDGKARVSVLSTALKSVEQRLPLHEQAVCICMLSLLWVTIYEDQTKHILVGSVRLSGCRCTRLSTGRIDAMLEKLCPGDSNATFLY